MNEKIDKQLRGFTISELQAMQHVFSSYLSVLNDNGSVLPGEFREAFLKLYPRIEQSLRQRNLLYDALTDRDPLKAEILHIIVLDGKKLEPLTGYTEAKDAIKAHIDLMDKLEPYLRKSLSSMANEIVETLTPVHADASPAVGISPDIANAPVGR